MGAGGAPELDLRRMCCKCGRPYPEEDAAGWETLSTHYGNVEVVDDICLDCVTRRRHIREMMYGSGDPPQDAVFAGGVTPSKGD